MHRRMALALTILAPAVAVEANFPAIADEKEKFVGTWKLVSAVSEDLSTGEKTDIYKALAVGFIAYSPDGRVMTITVNADRKKPVGADATAPEAEALFRSMVAYAGTYTVKGNQVIHRPDASWNETWTGTDQVRDYKFDGDRLSLAAAPSPSPHTGRMSVRTFVWEKVK